MAYDFILQEIADFIEDNTDLVVGTDLFAGAAPANAQDSHNIIIESGGNPDSDLSDYQEKTVQVLSKSTDYLTARAAAENIYSVLHCKAGMTFGNFYANVVEAITLPQSVGQDEKGLYTISTNYVLRIQNV